VNAEVSQLAVIRTRLPYVDQRALSQAWFTALHLAADVAMQTAPARASVRGATPPTGRAVVSTGHATPPQTNESTAIAHAGPRRSSLAASAADTRLRTRATCVRREPAALAQSVQPVFTATLQHARVQLALRRDGNRMQVIAVCSERHAPAVRKALALAAIALQMNGVATIASLRIGVSP
jgi:hypothetical protein